MSAVKGVNRTKLDTPIGENVIPEGINKASLFVIYDEYEASGLASGSTIKMGDTLPKGAVIQDVQVMTDDLGTGVTLDVGDSDDADRYMSTLDVAGASGAKKSLNADGNIDGVGYKVGSNDGDNQLVLTTGGGTATGTIKTKTVYAL